MSPDEEARQFLHGMMDDWDNWEYADNPRFAKVGCLSELRKYVKARCRGCCGFYDRIHTFQGVRFWIGFNYGH